MLLLVVVTVITPTLPVCMLWRLLNKIFLIKIGSYLFRQSLVSVRVSYILSGLFHICGCSCYVSPLVWLCLGVILCLLISWKLISNVRWCFLKNWDSNFFLEKRFFLKNRMVWLGKIVKQNKLSEGLKSQTVLSINNNNGIFFLSLPIIPFIQHNKLCCYICYLCDYVSIATDTYLNNSHFCYLPIIFC